MVEIKVDMVRCDLHEVDMEDLTHRTWVYRNGLVEISRVSLQADVIRAGVGLLRFGKGCTSEGRRAT